MLLKILLATSLVVGGVSPAAGTIGGSSSSPWPLGTFHLLPGHPGCLTGYSCRTFDVRSCSGVSVDAKGVIGAADPADVTTARGVVVFFSGGEGTDWWSAGSPLADQLLSRLRVHDHFVVIQVKWLDSWLRAPRGEDSGSAHLACRPATAIDWIYRNDFLPLGIQPGTGMCGFCVTGNSGGASQASYALSHYGLDTILNGVFPTSGPPHAAQVKGCLPGFPDYGYESAAVALLDLSSGFDDQHGDTGPCLTQDPSFESRWNQESVDTGANDLLHPATRIEFVIGANDTSSAVAHAADYRAALEKEPSNQVTWAVVQNMGHSIETSKTGLMELEQALAE
jgi:hypothetical protein